MRVSTQPAQDILGKVEALLLVVLTGSITEERPPHHLDQGCFRTRRAGRRLTSSRRIARDCHSDRMSSECFFSARLPGSFARVSTDLIRPLQDSDSTYVLARRLPNARRVVLRGTGHTAPHDDGKPGLVGNTCGRFSNLATRLDTTNRSDGRAEGEPGQEQDPITLGAPTAVQGGSGRNRAACYSAIQGSAAQVQMALALAVANPAYVLRVCQAIGFVIIGRIANYGSSAEDSQTYSQH